MVLNGPIKVPCGFCVVKPCRCSAIPACRLGNRGRCSDVSWAGAMLGNRMRLFDPTAPDEPSSAGEAEVLAAGPSGAASA